MFATETKRETMPVSLRSVFPGSIEADCLSMQSDKFSLGIESEFFVGRAELSATKFVPIRSPYRGSTWGGNDGPPVERSLHRVVEHQGNLYVLDEQPYHPHELWAGWLLPAEAPIVDLERPETVWPEILRAKSNPKDLAHRKTMGSLFPHFGRGINYQGARLLEKHGFAVLLSREKFNHMGPIGNCIEFQFDHGRSPYGYDYSYKFSPPNGQEWIESFDSSH